LVTGSHKNQRQVLENPLDEEFAFSQLDRGFKNSQSLTKSPEKPVAPVFHSWDAVLVYTEWS
jgi:hypothetical protein